MGMVRPKRIWEKRLIRFEPGTQDRIEAVLEPGEDRANFIRQAVETEIKRRERAVSRTAKDKGE